jgi:hypothetical protein
MFVNYKIVHAPNFCEPFVIEVFFDSDIGVRRKLVEPDMFPTCFGGSGVED